MKYYLIGIKGTGMSSLAVILKQLGNEVEGSDISKYIFTQEELEKNKIKINDFDVNNIEGIDLVIVGHNFINSDNVEVLEAKRKKIKIQEYNVFLSEFIKKYYSIAVCGSNGKSTTTALLSSILDNFENTSYLIGSGEASGNNSKYFTFEACEHEKHFLKYKPNIILVNNIDYDHVEFYKSKEDYKQAFYDFINNAKDKVIVNEDDVNLKDLKGVIFFGVNCKSMFNARNVRYIKGISYDLYYKDDFLRHIELDLYGEHMVYNTLAAVSCAISMGLDIDYVIEGIKKFKGVKRRFKETIVNDDVYVDDYAHHPSKIRAIINALRSKYPDKKIIAFYRPDRIKRLEYFSSEFNQELLKADKAYILPFINNTKEENDAINRFLKNYEKISLVNESVYKNVSKKNGVIYLMMSSKDISEVKENILKYKGD